MLYMGQWQVIGTVPTATFNIPPGVYNMAMYNVTGSTVWTAIGTSPTVPPPNFTSPTNGTVTGLQLHSVPTYWNGYQGSKGGYLWAFTTLSGTVPINYILSTQE